MKLGDLKTKLCFRRTLALCLEVFPNPDTKAGRRNRSRRKVSRRTLWVSELQVLHIGETILDGRAKPNAPVEWSAILPVYIATFVAIVSGYFECSVYSSTSAITKQLESWIFSLIPSYCFVSCEKETIISSCENNDILK